MNQVSKAAVKDIPKDSEEFAMVVALCRTTSIIGNVTNDKKGNWNILRNMLQKVMSFLLSDSIKKREDIK